MKSSQESTQDQEHLRMKSHCGSCVEEKSSGFFSFYFHCLSHPVFLLKQRTSSKLPGSKCETSKLMVTKAQYWPSPKINTTRTQGLLLNDVFVRIHRDNNTTASHLPNKRRHKIHINSVFSPFQLLLSLCKSHSVSSFLFTVYPISPSSLFPISFLSS